MFPPVQLVPFATEFGLVIVTSDPPAPIRRAEAGILHFA